MPVRACGATHLSLWSSGVAVAIAFVCLTIHEAAWHGPGGPNAKYFALERWVAAFQLVAVVLAFICGVVAVTRRSRPSAWIAFAAFAFAVIAAGVGGLCWLR